MDSEGKEDDAVEGVEEEEGDEDEAVVDVEEEEGEGDLLDICQAGRAPDGRFPMFCTRPW